eukprot:851712-Amphidinium_carterae.1
MQLLHREPRGRQTAVLQVLVGARQEVSRRCEHPHLPGHIACLIHCRHELGHKVAAFGLYAAEWHARCCWAARCECCRRLRVVDVYHECLPVPSVEAREVDDFATLLMLAIAAQGSHGMPTRKAQRWKTSPDDAGCTV